MLFRRIQECFRLQINAVIEEAAKEKGKQAKVSLNWMQAVLCVEFERNARTAEAEQSKRAASRVKPTEPDLKPESKVLKTAFQAIQILH